MDPARKDSGVGVGGEWLVPASAHGWGGSVAPGMVTTPPVPITLALGSCQG